MSPRAIQKRLHACSKDELVQIFIELIERNPAVERFLNSRLDPAAREPDLDNYKTEVRSDFFPAKGVGNGSPSIAFRMLLHVEAEATDPKQVIDFIYYCVETGVEYTDAYGDINEEFYAAFEDLFERAAQLALTNDQIDEFRARAHHIVSSTSEMGWGFHDELDRIFSEYFRDR